MKMGKILLKLYISGKSSMATMVIKNINRLIKEELKGNYELEIIDVIEKPHLAEEEKIFATPTLVKKLPLPLRKIIGDLTNIDKVLLGLDIVKIDRDSNSGGNSNEK